MKRYILFAGEYYYPGGGWTDFVGSFATVEEAVADYKARETADPYRWDWYQVLDMETWTIVVEDR
jgi:aminoglycoside phosphotransferase (APT) family kinase protein